MRNRRANVVPSTSCGLYALPSTHLPFIVMAAPVIGVSQEIEDAVCTSLGDRNLRQLVDESRDPGQGQSEESARRGRSEELAP